jgi:hypothetical protein
LGSSLSETELIQYRSPVGCGHPERFASGGTPEVPEMTLFSKRCLVALPGKRTLKIRKLPIEQDKPRGYKRLQNIPILAIHYQTAKFRPQKQAVLVKNSKTLDMPEKAERFLA